MNILHDAFDLFPLAGTALSSKVLDWTPTGSYFTCNPQVKDTDIDFAVRVHCLQTFGSALEDKNWTVTYDDPEYTICTNNEVPFITARQGKFNLIIFSEWAGFRAYATATHVAKHLNLLNKDDRVMLFQAVCGGRSAATTHMEDIF